TASVLYFSPTLRPLKTPPCSPVTVYLSLFTIHYSLLYTICPSRPRKPFRSRGGVSVPPVPCSWSFHQDCPGRRDTDSRRPSSPSACNPPGYEIRCAPFPHQNLPSGGQRVRVPLPAIPG